VGDRSSPDVALIVARTGASRRHRARDLTRLAQRLGLRGYDGVRKLYADACARGGELRGRAESCWSARQRRRFSAGPGIFASLTQHLQICLRLTQ